ncbi:hypothetical protein C8Q75DRAFT_735942 [Abortiporus biennis]|nr:hypothetical protein C8Q75DRAFT_735942 [Abortiporus biennis]
MDHTIIMRVHLVKYVELFNFSVGCKVFSATSMFKNSNIRNVPLTPKGIHFRLVKPTNCCVTDKRCLMTIPAAAAPFIVSPFAGTRTCPLNITPRPRVLSGSDGELNFQWFAGIPTVSLLNLLMISVLCHPYLEPKPGVIAGGDRCILLVYGVMMLSHVALLAISMSGHMDYGRLGDTCIILKPFDEDSEGWYSENVLYLVARPSGIGNYLATTNISIYPVSSLIGTLAIYNQQSSFDPKTKSNLSKSGVASAYGKYKSLRVLIVRFSRLLAFVSFLET